MRLLSKTIFPFLLLTSLATAKPVVYPYLQNLTETSADLYWVDENPKKVWVTWSGLKAKSTSEAAPQLAYQAAEVEEFPQLKTKRPLFLHHVTLSQLKLEQVVHYQVHFPKTRYHNSFKTLPGPRTPVRLIAYADSETEPESTGKAAKWGTPQEPKRRYLVDQTTGYRENLRTIRYRTPDAVLIAGDLVESGGEQRDWDEFWRQNKDLAGSLPLLPAPGNHEYWAGPKHGGYTNQGSRWAIDKYRTYFHPKGQPVGRQYYSQDIGKATIISLDSGDGLEHGSNLDTNHYLTAAGDFAPGFHPGGDQWLWLEKALKDGQARGQFIIVMFHHCPYSSGNHGFEPGSGPDQDEQSGQAMRVLTPLLMNHGVDLVLTGHDEMFERSTIPGLEIKPNGQKQFHSIQVYDVGVGGDGLRGPKRENRYGRFLANSHSPEVWKSQKLIRGGRHYGHLEINITPTDSGWTAELTPVYVLPRQRYANWLFQRQVYPDVLKLSGN